jgi:hypothetical protein
VDAINNGKATKFYEKNGFSYVTGNDEKEKTRIMRYDLMEFNPP